jgi:hypothetical protein
MNRRNDFGLSGAVIAGGEKPSESLLVFWVLINIRNAQLWLLQENMVGTVEYLPLFCDGMHYRFQRRTPIY